jgi:hypothetical protein
MVIQTQLSSKQYPQLKSDIPTVSHIPFFIHCYRAPPYGLLKKKGTVISFFLYNVCTYVNGFLENISINANVKNLPKILRQS